MDAPAFSNPTRLKLLDILADGDRYSVSELAADAEVSQSAVSQHLKQMRDQAVVVRERRGIHTYYRLTDERIVEAMERIREAIVEDMTD